MPIVLLNNLLIAFFDGIGELITPSANFSPPAGDYALSNLTNSQLFSRVRTPDLTADRQLTWDWGSAIEHNIFMLAGTNATSAATRRIRDADNSGFSSGVIESGATLTSAFDTSLGLSRAIYVPPWGRTLIYVYPTSISKRYTRWHQTDSANPDGYQEWGIARVGLGWQSVGGFQSWKFAPLYQGAPGAEKVLRGHEFTLHNLTKSEAYDLQSILLSMLSTRRVLVIPEPLAPSTWLHDAIWCVSEEVYVREPIAGTSYADKRYKVVVMFREVDV